MKNFNKDNSMKKFKCVLGMAALALSMAGNAVAAQPTMPTVPSNAPIITVTTTSEWEGLQDKIDLLSSSEKDLIIRVSGDISFSSNIGMPWSGAPVNLNKSIDMHKRNVYIVGEKNNSSNSLSGILLKGAGASLLKNVDTVYIENVDLKNCYLLAEADDSHNSAAFLASRARGVYLNKVTLENVGVKGVPDAEGKTPVFSNVAFLVDSTICAGASCGAFVARDLSVDGLTIDSLRSAKTGGFVAYASGSVSMQSSQLKNISVGFSTDDPNWDGSTASSLYLGGVVAQITSVASLYIQNSSIELAPLKFESVDLESSFIYMGGFVGSLEVGTIQLEKSTFSGNIDIVNNQSGISSIPLKPRVGGVAGYWMPKSSIPVLNLQMDDCISSVNISTNIEHSIIVSGTYDEELDFSFTSSFGGFFGSLMPSVESLSGVINRSTYSGKIDYKSKVESFSSIGGFIGIWGNGSITFNNNVVNGSGISYRGPYAAIGSLVGTVKNTKTGVFVNNLEVDNAIEASISPTEGVSVGGVFGLAVNSPVALNGASIKSEIAVNDLSAFAPPLPHSIDLSMGGIVGYIGNSDSLQMQNVSYEGSLSTVRHYASISKAQYVGGLVGKLKNTSVSIDSARVEGKDGSLMSVRFAGGKDNDRFDAVQMGGLIGGSPFLPSEGGRPSLSISESFVSGTIAATDMKNSDTSCISGFVGLYSVADSVKISDSYYKGALTAAMTKPSANKVSGFMTLVAGARAVSVNNSYVYDANATASKIVIGQPDLTETKAYMFSSLDESLEWNTVEASSPAFAYLLNEGEATPHWGYNANENDGLPQLTFKLGENVEPIKRVILRGFDESGDTPADVEIYTDAEGKWELAANGKRFSEDLFVPSYDSKAKKLVAWTTSDGTVWNGLAETSDKLKDGMVFKKQVSDLPKVIFTVDTTGGSSGKESRVVLWDNPEYSLVDSTDLPSAVFKLVNGNNDSAFYKGSFWKIEGQSLLAYSSKDLIEYAIKKKTTEVKLEFALDSLYKLMLSAHNGGYGMTAEEKALQASLEGMKFQTVLFTSLPEVEIRYTVMGYERETTFRPQLIVLPKLDTLAILGVKGADSSEVTVVLSNYYTKDTIGNASFGEKIGLSTKSLNDTLLVTTMNRPANSDTSSSSSSSSDPSSSSSSSSSSNPDNPSGSDPSTPGSVVNRSGECADSVAISESHVLQSGSAALFAFTIEIPAFCQTVIKPRVIVSGPDTVLMDTVLNYRKKNEFVFYPLNPGMYSFKVNASSKKSKTIKKKFSADIELRGRAWNMVAYGSWPKNALKGAKPTIYMWNESNAIGDYWQYESLPNGYQADELTGYWVRSEKALSFSLDLPLKKAESDSLSWTVDKKFSGWNLLANPYSWNLYVGSVEGFKSPENGSAPIWRWNAADARYDVSDTLFANEAFWVSTDKKRTLSVSTKPVFPAPKVASKKKNSLLKSSSKNSWSMVLVATSENGVSDMWNVFGVGSRDIAIAEPPAGMGDAVRASFVGEGSALLAKRILAKASADEYSWNVNLNASKSEKVNLSLEGLDEVRALGYRAVLVMDGKTYEWDESSTISVETSGSKTAELKVVPAKAQVSLSKGISDMKYSVAAGQLAVNFSVPAEMAGKVAEVRLLDMNGNVVSVASSRAQAGTNDMRLASARNGVYVLMVRVGSATRSARIAF